MVLLWFHQSIETYSYQLFYIPETLNGWYRFELIVFVVIYTENNKYQIKFPLRTMKNEASGCRCSANSSLVRVFLHGWSGS